jgi:hypothetical protein
MMIIGGVDPFSPKYRLSSIICDVASFRLFKPVRSEPLHDNNRKFLHIPFANKGIDAINISNIHQYNGFFRILSELVFCLRYTITKACRLTDLHVLSIL